jgi:predicted Fe-Mo cluster-binding NifX family protein
MKIAIPVDENSMETEICMSFGRTPWFLIFDTVTEEKNFINNSAAASLGGAGIVAAQTLVDLKVEVMLTPRCGQNAADVFNAANIKIYRTKSSMVSENIKAFLNGELSPLGEIHEGFHNQGEK